MNFKDWINKLDERGSADDPIIHNGQQTTPNQLSYGFHSLDSVDGIHIEYWAGDGCQHTRRVRGTTGGMLRERSRGFKPERRPRFTLEDSQ